MNSMAFKDVDPESGEVVFVGSKMEMALLTFTKELGWVDFRRMRDHADIMQMIPFSNDQKSMGVAVQKEGGKRYRVFFKGATKILLKKCTRHVVITPPPQGKKVGSDMGQDEEQDEAIEMKEIDLLVEENISRTIIFYANQTLWTIALCYRDFESWPSSASIFSATRSSHSLQTWTQRNAM